MGSSNKCDLSLVYAALAGAIAACAVAVTAGFQGHPYIALGAAVAALALAIVIGPLFDGYKRCRDSESGSSDCSVSSIENYLNAIRVCLGIAVAGYIIAASALSIPWVGEYISGTITTAVTYAGTLIAAGLLVLLGASLDAYKSCRDRSGTPLGDGSNSITHRDDKGKTR